jgi:hypothetical protein
MSSNNRHYRSSKAIDAVAGIIRRANDNDTHCPLGSSKEPGMYEDEDNDSKFPDESPVETSDPPARRQEEHADRGTWRWLAGFQRKKARARGMVRMRGGARAGCRISRFIVASSAIMAA